MKVAFFLPSLSGGGAERVAVNLLSSLQLIAADRHEPLQLQLLLGEASGPYLDFVPEGVSLVDLQRPRMSRVIFALRKQLKADTPDVLVSHLSHANLASLLAGTLRRRATKRVIVEHLTMSAYRGEAKRDRWIRPLARRLYPKADAIVAVSQGAAADLESTIGLPAGSVRVIHNPVVNDSLRQQAQEPPTHPWFTDGQGPVLLAAGRLTPQKDFATAIEAMSLLREQSNARLVILGEGELRDSLSQLVADRNLQEYVDLPGFLPNPYSLMNAAACLVLSSRWEALPTVVIEALACGCSVVATDCPSGPAEILEDGRLGRLVPIQNPAALADAIQATLKSPAEKDQLRQRAEQFSFQRAGAAYFDLFQELARPAKAVGQSTRRPR